MANINIEIDDELHKNAKIKALMKDISLKDFIIKSLEKKVAMDEKRGVDEKFKQKRTEN